MLLVHSAALACNRPVAGKRMIRSRLRWWTTCWLRPAGRRRPNVSPFQPMGRRRWFVRLGNPSSRHRRQTLELHGQKARTVLRTSSSLHPSSLNSLPRKSLRRSPNQTMGMCRLSTAFPAVISTTATIRMTTLVLHLLPSGGPSRPILPVCLGVRPKCPLVRATCRLVRLTCRLGRVGHGRR